MAQRKSIEEIEEEFAVDVSYFDVNLKSAEGLLATLNSEVGSSANAQQQSKKFLIGANWKCNGTTASVAKLVTMLNGAGKLLPHVEVVVAPTTLHIPYVAGNLRSDMAVSAQNSALSAKEGAFTGEITASQFKDFGLGWVILGHSERRAGFGAAGESSELVATKTKVAVDSGLNVIACIGETLEEREAGKTVAVLEGQLAALAKALKPSDWSSVAIAYEPVWAIGTGRTATPAQAQEAHAAIRAWIAKNVSQEAAAAVRIMYGGSVNGTNAKELSNCEDIEGFLVGGASLKEDFISIINAPEQKFKKHASELFERMGKISEAIDHLCHQDDGSHDLLVKCFDMKQTKRLAQLQSLINGDGEVDGDPAGGVKMLMKTKPEDFGTERHWEIMWHLIHCWQAAKAFAHAKLEVVEAFNQHVKDFDICLKKAEKHLEILVSGNLGTIKLNKNMLELFENLAKIAHLIEQVCINEDGNHGFMARSFDKHSGRLQRLLNVMTGGSEFGVDAKGGVRLKMKEDPEHFGESAHVKTMDDLEHWHKMAFATASNEFLKHLKKTKEEETEGRI